ncbi:MAG TPA: metal-dependent transcriptional regulator [Gemmatimonadota bacterium]|jgi:DtxR family Mn-dependent transcriptional regulator|nr:metal-dependent transcriptional regulator [Gemmatimonadota bacterium]
MPADMRPGLWDAPRLTPRTTPGRFDRRMVAQPLPEITPPIEDYLKVIYTLVRERGEERASTSAISERMDVSAASATNMMQKLADMRLVEYVPYRGVALTDAGEKIALEVIRHHRLIELYLSEALGYSWDAVHDEAERLEHVISEEFEDRIDAMLGHPTTDPHGDPIPPKIGRPPARATRRLSEVEIDERVVVRSVSDREAEFLRRLASLELVPGTRITVVSRQPGGAMTIERNGDPLSIEQDLARRVFVEEPAVTTASKEE